MIANIWAVGRNYQDHARELNNPVPKEPLFFLKAGSCVQAGPDIHLLPSAGEIHHEVELALLIDANLGFSHFAIALDLTDRTAQNKAKAEGLPWTRAKSFLGACVLADWKPYNESPEFFDQIIELKINREIKQKAPLSQMVFKPKFLLETLKEAFPVQPGDVLLTGTPSGVGPLKKGDQLQARIGTATNASWVVA